MFSLDKWKVADEVRDEVRDEGPLTASASIKNIEAPPPGRGAASSTFNTFERGHQGFAFILLLASQPLAIPNNATFLGKRLT